MCAFLRDLHGIRWGIMEKFICLRVAPVNIWENLQRMERPCVVYAVALEQNLEFLQVFYYSGNGWNGRSIVTSTLDPNSEDTLEFSERWTSISTFHLTTCHFWRTPKITCFF
jgi:hypothetical protein